jgi:hypothetical protein
MLSRPAGKSTTEGVGENEVKALRGAVLKMGPQRVTWSRRFRAAVSEHISKAESNGDCRSARNRTGTLMVILALGRD